MKGTVKFFNESKNFGFIEPEDKSKDLFVHRNDIVEGPIRDGDEVEYEVTPSKWGPRMKLTKPGFTPNQGGGQSPDIQKRIDASWAIGHAINQESDPEKIVEAAEWLLKF